jgi:hypothetical protein
LFEVFIFLSSYYQMRKQISNVYYVSCFLHGFLFCHGIRAREVRLFTELGEQSAQKSVGDITTHGGSPAEGDSKTKRLRFVKSLLQEENAEVAEEKLQQSLDQPREQIWAIRSSLDRTRSAQRSRTDLGC